MDAIFVAGFLTIIALFGLLGTMRKVPISTVAHAVGISLPLVAVCAASSLHRGFTLGYAFLAVGTVLLGVLLAAANGPIRSVPIEGRAVAAGIGWFCSGAVLFGVTGLFVAWIADLISAFTTLNAASATVVLILGSMAVGFGNGAEIGLARLVLIAVISTAVLLLLAGFFAGSVEGVTDPAIFTRSVPFPELIFFSISMVLVGGTHQGLRSLAGENRRNLIVGAVILSVCVLVSMIGLLMLVGGAFKLPSVPLETLVAYTPPALGALIAGALAVVTAVVVGQTLSRALRTTQSLWPVLVPIRHGVIARLVGCIVLGVILLLIAEWPASPEWAVPLLAGLGLLGLIIEHVGAKHQRVAVEAKQTAEAGV